MNRIADGISYVDLLIVIVLVGTFKILFFFTGFILEDSFIVFRSSFNLADFGSFSYNLGELNSATTSKVFGLICAFLRLLFKNYAIISIIIFNSFVSVISSILIFYSVRKLTKKDIFSSREIFFFIIILVFLNPSISIIGIVGLEFSILVFFISLIFFSISKDSIILLAISAIFIPFIRMELIGFILILSFFYLYFLKFKELSIVILSGILGIILNGLLNNIFDGTFLPGPAVSKWNTLSESNLFSINRIFYDLRFWFFEGRSFFLGVYSRFIPNLLYSFVALVIIILSIQNIKFLFYKKFINISTKYKIYILTISATIIILPLSYVLGGHIWDWYLYPYSNLSYILLTIIVLENKYFDYLKFPIMIIIIIVTIFQFAILTNIGFQENSYRSVVGKNIYEMSENKDKDTLFLEPAGYIPFYAKIKTYDTVGLSSPEILKYRNIKNNRRWWLNFIQDKMPTFILDRNDIRSGYSHDGEYSLNEDEINWFKANYELVSNYNYQDYVKKYAGSLVKFYEHGNHANYFLYKKK